MSMHRLRTAAQRLHPRAAFSADPMQTPVSRTGKALESWDAYHNQFLGKPIRQGIDSDERDIGAYPDLTSGFDYRDRDARAGWQDPVYYRNYGEPVPEHMDLRASVSPGLSGRPLYVLVGVGCGFLAAFAAFHSLCEWLNSVYGPMDKAAPMELPYNLPNQNLRAR